MKKMKLFLDTHNTATGTFPEGISNDQFAGFYETYQQACSDNGVVPLQVFTGMEAGKAFCLTLAEDIDAVERAHQQAGLPFDSITEVKSTSPGDLFLQVSA